MVDSFEFCSMYFYYSDCDTADGAVIAGEVLIGFQ